MALSLVYGCRLTIWCYLADEERSFLERIFPSERFTETKATRLSPQKIVKFAIRANWEAPLQMFGTCINLNVAYAMAVACNRDQFADTLRAWGATDIELALKEAAAANNIPAMEKILDMGALKIGDALISAAGSNAIEAMDYNIRRFGIHDEKVLDLAAEEAAKKGSNKALKWVWAHGGLDYGYAEACFNAARFGHLDTIQMIWEETAKLHSDGLIFASMGEKGAAYGGSFEALHLVAKLSRTSIDYGTILVQSSYGNQVKMMQWAKDLCQRDLPYYQLEAFSGAAKKGSIDALKLLYEWMKRDFNDSIREERLRFAIIDAAENNRTDAIKLLVEWRKEPVHLSLVEPSSTGAIQAMHLLRELGACDFEASLIKASANCEIGAMALLKEWGALNFKAALYVVEQPILVSPGNLDDDKVDKLELVAKILKRWIAE